MHGSDEAWAALLDKYKNLIYSIPIKRGFAREDAAEVFQRVCLWGSATTHPSFPSYAPVRHGAYCSTISNFPLIPHWYHNILIVKEFAFCD